MLGFVLIAVVVAFCENGMDMSRTRLALFGGILLSAMIVYGSEVESKEPPTPKNVVYRKTNVTDVFRDCLKGMATYSTNERVAAYEVCERLALSNSKTTTRVDTVWVTPDTLLRQLDNDDFIHGTRTRAYFLTKAEADICGLTRAIYGDGMDDITEVEAAECVLRLRGDKHH